jgi:hypothetical protein
VHLTGGHRFALKLAAETAPLREEVATLTGLRERGCPVPRIVAVDRSTEPAWVALEWVGDETLDHALQTAPTQRRSVLGRALAQALSNVQAAFAPITARERQSERWDARCTALREQTMPWVEAAPDALAWLVGRALHSAELDALAATLRLALAAEPEVGSLDYHAANVICDGSRVKFVDWPSVGCDWTERRLAQYATATGAGLPDGNFASALGPAAVRAYAQSSAVYREIDAEDVAQTVDAHEVLLLLTAAASLRMVAEGAAHAERAASWAKVPARRERLLRLLRRRLTLEGPVADLRALLRQVKC